jgi:tetratricopeptide (TPR) repeat protein
MSSARVLSTLNMAGNSDRLVTEARRFLGIDPEDIDAHFYLVLGHCNLRQFREAERHLQELLRLDPESVNTHVAAVRFHLLKENMKAAERFAAAGMRIDPHWPYFPLALAIVASNRHRPAEARQHISRARELAPEDPEIVNLHIRLHAAMETTAKDAWKRLREYEAALRLDPGNASLHNSIGDVYLNELENPSKAEEHYRTALQADPQDRDYQRDLFQAVAQRSVVYRLFSLPSRTFVAVRNILSVIRDHPWVVIFLLLAFKFVLAFAAWLAVATVLLWPGCKVYEWFVVSELRSASDTPVRMLSLWLRIRRFPLWLRFGAFLAFSSAIWSLLFLTIGMPLGRGFLYLGIFLSVHLVVVAGLMVLKQFDAWTSGRKARRPPPL